MNGCSGMTSRVKINYFDLSDESSLDIYHVASMILDLVEGNYQTTSEYLKSRINHSLVLLGIKEKIKSTRHAEYPNLIDDLINGKLTLNTEALSLFRGVMEWDPKYPDLAANFKTLDDLKVNINATKQFLSKINYQFLINYFKFLDESIIEKSIPFSELIKLGLPNPAPFDDGEY